MNAAWFVLLTCSAAWAELPVIPVAPVNGAALDPSAPAWKATPSTTLSLQRTPLLYPTDQPTTLDIPTVQIQILRAPGHVYARLEWKDKTQDGVTLAKAERSWQGEHLVKQSGATNRFADACAVMIPVSASEVYPSLQMGDPQHPVRIYLWDATRGSAVMEARGRETTRKTGNTYPSQSAWTNGRWSVVMELPELPSGTPIAVAIWNGDQQDRDGRKYFSVWYKTQ